MPLLYHLLATVVLAVINSQPAEDRDFRVMDTKTAEADPDAKSGAWMATDSHSWQVMWAQIVWGDERKDPPDNPAMQPSRPKVNFDNLVAIGFVGAQSKQIDGYSIVGCTSKDERAAIYLRPTYRAASPNPLVYPSYLIFTTTRTWKPLDIYLQVGGNAANPKWRTVASFPATRDVPEWVKKRSSGSLGLGKSPTNE